MLEQNPYKLAGEARSDAVLPCSRGISGAHYLDTLFSQYKIRDVGGVY